MVLLLMVQKSCKQPPGMVLKPVVNNGINYQPQLISLISEPSTVVCLPKKTYAAAEPKQATLVKLGGLCKTTPYVVRAQSGVVLFSQAGHGKAEGFWGLGVGKPSRRFARFLCLHFFGGFVSKRLFFNKG